MEVLTQKTPTQEEVEYNNLTEYQLHQLFLTEVKNLKREMGEFRTVIEPMVESYQAAVRLGKWGTAATAFIAIILGIFQTIKSLAAK